MVRGDAPVDETSSLEYPGTGRFFVKTKDSSFQDPKFELGPPIWSCQRTNARAQEKTRGQDERDQRAREIS